MSMLFNGKLDDLSFFIFKINININNNGNISYLERARAQGA